MTQFFINSTKVLVNDGHIKIRTGDSSTPPPPQQTVAGYIVSGAGRSNYNGTYCLFGTFDNNPMFKHSTQNLYIFGGQSPYMGPGGSSGGDYWWIGPIVGNIYGDSDGYYTFYNGNTPNLDNWYSYPDSSITPTLSVTTCQL